MNIRFKLKQLFSNKSFTTLSLLLFSLILFKIFFLLFPFQVRISDQEKAISWLNIFSMIALGYAGYFFSTKISVPQILDRRVNNFQRLIIPSITGLAYGLITIYHDFRQHVHHPYQLSDKVHVVFPQSVVFYTYGAIFLEAFLRLFGISFIVWLFSKVIFRNKFETFFFLIAALITSWYEVMPYIESYSFNEVFGGIFSVLFIANMLEAYEFKKYGFLAPVVFRFVFYMAWHIVWGSLITRG